MPSVIVEGVVKADGTLELSEKLTLPPGPVQVTVLAAPAPVADGGTLLDCIRKIREDQKARGYVPRSAEEIDADLRAMREEVDEHAEELDRQREIWYEERKRAQP